MRSVTVRGSRVRPCTDLPAGQLAQVALTDSVRHRIDLGFYELVEPKSLDEADVLPALERADEKTPPEQADGVSEDEVTPEVAVPHENASKDVWLAFLQSKGIEVPADEDGKTPGRNALRDLWHASVV